MKKLMIAAAMVCAAAFAQAAATDWTIQIKSTGAFTGLDGSERGGTLYLFYYDATSSTQDQFLQAVLVDGATSTLAEYAKAHAAKETSSATVAKAFTIGDNGRLTTTSFYTPVDENLKQSFFALVDTGDGKYYINKEATYSADAISGGAITLSLATAGDKTDYGDSWTSYQGAGWYSAQAVPEPTSGLLLLLGVAGLALRRRRA